MKIKRRIFCLEFDCERSHVRQNKPCDAFTVLFVINVYFFLSSSGQKIEPPERRATDEKCPDDKLFEAKKGAPCPSGTAETFVNGDGPAKKFIRRRYYTVWCMHAENRIIWIKNDYSRYVGTSWNKHWCAFLFWIRTIIELKNMNDFHPWLWVVLRFTVKNNYQLRKIC